MQKKVFGLGIFILTSLISGLVQGTSTSQLLVTAKAEVDKTLITIGEKIKYSIVVEAPKNVEVDIPSFSDNVAGGLAVKDFGSYHKFLWGKKRIVQWYLLDTYITGKYTIPQVIVKYRVSNDPIWQEVTVKEIPIEVKSFLSEELGASLDIRDIKGPLALPQSMTILIISILVVVTCLIGVISWFLVAHKVRESMNKPKLSAHEVAYRALDRLRSKDYIKQGIYKDYYIELSNIVRHYLEDRFQVKAPEMTTEEFLLAIKDTNILSYDEKALLREFLSQSDMVKFAQYAPGETEMELSMQAARKLIDETKQEEPQLLEKSS